jgi:hypothetical protein
MVEEVDVRKPDADVKQYRFVVLNNSLKALLISDPRIDITQGMFAGTDGHAVCFLGPIERIL